MRVGLGQNCSKPALHSGQVPSESTRQPTAARSPGLNLVTAGADLGDAADDFMAGNAGIDGGHEAAPLVAGLVKVGVADAAEEDFDLHVVVGGIAALDGGRKQTAKLRWRRNRLWLCTCDDLDSLWKCRATCSYLRLREQAAEAVSRSFLFLAYFCRLLSFWCRISVIGSRLR